MLKPIKGTQLNNSFPANKLVACFDFLAGVGDRISDLSPNRGRSWLLGRRYPDGSLTGFSFPGTASSGWNPGKFGRNLVFDGTDDYVNCLNTVSDIRTISFWAKPSSTTERFLQIGTLISIYLQSGVVMAYGLDSSTIYVDGVNTTTFPNDGRWHNVTVVGASSVTGNDINIGLEALNGGANLDLNGTYYAQAANNTIHDVGTQDFGLAAWIKVDTDASGVGMILNKDGGAIEWTFRYRGDGLVSFTCSDGVTAFSVTGTTNVRDNKWHHVAAIVDRNNAANCNIYVDGTVETPTLSGDITLVGSLANTGILYLSYTATRFDGQVRDLVLAYPIDIMAANEMGASGEILYLATHPFDKTNYCNYEDYWSCTDGSGTTVTGDVNNLTLSNVAAWSTEGQYYPGQIDLVRMFSIPLTQQMIRQLYRDPFLIYQR